MQNNELSGKVVCITGAAGGIGSAIARAFAGAGAHLALLDIDERGLSRLANELPGEQSHSITVSTAVADLSTEQGVKGGISEALAPFDGRVDILSANVGFLIAQRFEELTAEQWHRGFALNFFTHVYACQEVIPRMKRQGGGSIIFTGSDQGLQPDAGLGPYAQAKAAVHSLVKMLARELPPDGILVSAVAPGMTRTPLVETLMEGYAREFQTDRKTAEKLELQRRGVPLGRLGEPEEVADAVLYLATSPFCNGTILNISGGNVRAVMC
ncbi:MAG TPA: SDR family oxidoreductase [Ktedonobacteraceae bacterium]|nr:SDR family oxidoreductase [Ktedonobacteraceae bacterium]